jgi:hypothetical protein
MELRKNPFMLNRGISIWPAAWIWTFGGSNFHPTGEIGMLENIRPSAVDPDKCFIMMSYDEEDISVVFSLIRKDSRS